MNINFWLALVFGLTTIATVFVGFGWWKILKENNVSRKYLTVALGTLTANLGVCILTFNRTSAALIGVDMFPYGVIAAGIVILTGKIAWMIGMAMGLSMRPIAWYIICAVAWIGFCIGWFYG